MIEQNLERLWNESEHIILEASANFKNPAILFSGGKDSTVMLWIIKNTFGKIPYPVIYIDNGNDFKETQDFIHKLENDWDFNLIEVKEYPENPEDKSSLNQDSYNKITGLQKVVKKNKFDALFVAIKSTENAARSKERFFSKRKSNFKYDWKNHDMEAFGLLNSSLKKGQHMRIHPILDWNELSVWKFIKEHNIPFNLLYLSKNGHRYRSLGTRYTSAPIESNADTIDKIIEELKNSSDSEERTGRDQEKEKVMERLRALGYM